MSDINNDEVVIVVPVVLGATLIVLAVSVVVFIAWYSRRKRIWCFARAERKTKPLPFHTPAEIQSRLQHKRRLHGFKGNRKTKLDHSIKKALLSDQSEGDVQNPLVGIDELEDDFTNPVFDVEAATYLDAAINIQSWWRMLKLRIPYLQLREAALLVQALWRGKQCRRIFPELKKRKLHEQQRKKSTGVFNKKGRLAMLQFYDVKGFGFAEVEQLYGLETIREATSQLKKMYGGKGKMKLKVLISVHGIKLFDAFTLAHYATVKMSSISFCTMDPKNKRVFAFINRKKKRNFCHVFQCQEGDALKMVETMAEAFECTFKQQEKLQQSQRGSQQLSESQLSISRLGQKRSIAEIPRLSTSDMSVHSSHHGSRETLSSVGSKQIARHSIKTSQANARSSTSSFSGNKHRSSNESSPMATGKLIHERPRRNSQLSNKTKTHTATAQAEQQQQQYLNLVSHDQKPSPPQPDYLSDLQKAMDDLRILSS